MKAAIYSADGGVRLAEFDVPDPLPGWVRLSVAAAGLCGTDLHIRRGATGSPGGIRPGHEIGAWVETVGEGVDLAPGTLVAVEPIVGCGQCRFCRSGRANLCAMKKFIGHSLPGGLADFMVAPAANVYAQPAATPPSLAALCEPMAVAARGVRRGNVQPGSRVAIMGAGSIGLLSILAARARGALEIFCSGRYGHQRDMALHFGATAVFQDGAEMLDAIGDQHVEVVIETVGGQASTLGEAIRVVATGGTVVMLGAFTGETTLPLLRMMLNEINLVSSHCHARDGGRPDFQAATDLVCQNREWLPEMVTHQFHLDRVTDAYSELECKSGGAIKIQLTP